MPPRSRSGPGSRPGLRTSVVAAGGRRGRHPRSSRPCRAEGLMRTIDRLSSTAAVSWLRSGAGRLRRAMMAQHPAVRLGLVLAPVILLAAAGYWAAGTLAPAGTALPGAGTGVLVRRPDHDLQGPRRQGDLLSAGRPEDRGRGRSVRTGGGPPRQARCRSAAPSARSASRPHRSRRCSRRPRTGSSRSGSAARS